MNMKRILGIACAVTLAAGMSVYAGQAGAAPDSLKTAAEEAVKEAEGTAKELVSEAEEAVKEAEGAAKELATEAEEAVSGVVSKASEMIEAVEDQTESETEMINGVANPFTDYATLSEAEAQAGFSLNVPEEAAGYKAVNYRAADFGMLEVIFKNDQGDKMTVRKSPNDGDISGDYNEYNEVVTLEDDQIQVEISGNDGLFGKAVWNEDAFAYAIMSSAGISQEDMEAMVRDMIEANKELPKYEYTGSDPYIQAINLYLEARAGAEYAPSDVMIPIIMIYRVDDTDPEDIKVWGSFWILNYLKDGTALKAVSGGNYPGLIHLAKTEDGVIPLSMECAEDGSNWTSSLEALCAYAGENAKALIAEYMEHLSMDEEYTRACRIEAVQEYVNQFGLDIDRIQDYGWDPISILDPVRLSEEYSEIETENPLESIDIRQETTDEVVA